MKTIDEKLKTLRGRIDELDEQLLALLNSRARLALEIAECKAGDGAQAGTNHYYHPDRETEVLNGLLEKNEGPLPRDEVARLFREVMSACRALQKPMAVAFLGPEGTFAQAAALRHFGRSVRTVPLESIEAVFREVEAGNSDYGVVPVENSAEGVVSHTLDLFVRSPLNVCGEVTLRIHQHLLVGVADAGGLEGLKKVYSHQQSLAQCRRWLDRHLPSVERVNVSSNAEGARRASSEPRAAAIASDIAGKTYGLRSLASNIEDEPDNSTRFIVIGDRRVSPTGADKTSLLLSAKDRPGALYGLLEPFAKRGISMTRIESRPARSGLWKYVFFVDIEGHGEDPAVADALAEIEGNATLFKVLGSYPRAVV